MKEKVSVIGGADGTTSIFIAGNMKRHGKSLISKWKEKAYEKKKEMLIQQIPIKPRSLDKVIRFIEKRYQAVEISKDEWGYIENYKDIKASYVVQFYPELIETPLPVLKKEDYEDEQRILEYFTLQQEQREQIAMLPSEEVPIDFHMYDISVPEAGTIQVCIEKLRRVLSISYSCKGEGNKKELEAIVRKIYCYYGVSMEDVSKRTERLENLVAVLLNK